MELFKRLSRDELPALAKAAVEVSFPKGAVIITQNGEGHEFCVIKKYVKAQSACQSEDALRRCMLLGHCARESSVRRNRAQ